MMGPLWLLALLSIAGAALGGAALGLTFPEFLRGDRARRCPHGPHWLTPFSVGLALAGIAPRVARLPAAGGLGRGAHARARTACRAWAARGYGLDALYVAIYRGVVLALRAGSWAGSTGTWSTGW